MRDIIKTNIQEIYSYGVYRFHLGIEYGKLAGYCEHANEHAVSIRSADFLE
jgi:hypothetical protein